jgi:hypothetical protein
MFMPTCPCSADSSANPLFMPNVPAGCELSLPTVCHIIDAQKKAPKERIVRGRFLGNRGGYLPRCRKFHGVAGTYILD